MGDIWDDICMVGMWDICEAVVCIECGKNPCGGPCCVEEGEKPVPPCVEVGEFRVVMSGFISGGDGIELIELTLGIGDSIWAESIESKKINR